MGYTCGETEETTVCSISGQIGSKGVDRAASQKGGEEISREKETSVEGCKRYTSGRYNGMWRHNAGTDADKRRRWREYISRYHTIGYKQAYGAQLKYFITSDGVDLGCLQFSAAAWALQKRDEWIGWSVEDRKARLNLVLNNSRYLVLPWVHIRNLSSRALSAAARRICEDWLNAYCYAPVLLETFVDTTFYRGTSYLSANWVYLGETQGRGRMDRHHEHGLSQKAIFMYPLRKDFRAVLQGRKPCKMVNPDE